MNPISNEQTHQVPISSQTPISTTPSLSDTIAILSDIWKTSADIPGNEHILEKIHSHIKTQLPPIIKNYHISHTERETRKKSLEVLSEEFIETFLNKYQYYYSHHSDLYMTYTNHVRYSIINEDEIHHRILSEITTQYSKSLGTSPDQSNSVSILPWKYKIKNRIIKSIQERDILKSIPESRTIQNIIGYLYPALFRTRDHAKYFLTLLGDIILKKSGQLIYFIPASAKEFIKDIGHEYYGLFGAHAFSTAFKFKYYEHNYADCRIVDFQVSPSIMDNGVLTAASSAVTATSTALRLSYSSELKSSMIDLFCVAAHYSQRFGSADEYLTRHCKTVDVREHAWYFKIHTENQIIDEFMKYATEPSVDCAISGITWQNMLYLWKMYLDEFHLPSMFFNATLKTRIVEYLLATQPSTNHDNASSPSSSSLPQPDIIPNRTSRYLPLVTKFMKFWSDMCFIDDNEIELEIDEMSTLFNDYLSESDNPISTNYPNHHQHQHHHLSNISDTALLGMIRHFYPDVMIEDDKYLINVGCHMWGKRNEIMEYLESFKTQCITNHLSIPQPLYNAYEYYCAQCYTSKMRRAVSKRYFEKFFMEEYSEYLDENGLISMGWWSNQDDAGPTASPPQHILS